MSLDLTVGTRSAAPAAAQPEVDDADEAATGPRLWLYELLIAASAVFGAILASAVSVLLYLR
jgi:hypothetical protein